MRNHVRFGLQDGGVVSGAKAVKQGLGTDMDWLIGVGHFEYLFSTRVAIEWVRRRYFRKFPTENSMTIDGFGRFERGLTVIPDGLREEHEKRGARVPPRLPPPPWLTLI